MDYSDALLGRYQARKLQEKAGAPILIIGSDRFTRHDLAAVECFNFTAAANLSAILNDGLQVKNTAHVFNSVAPIDLALPRLGVVSLAVLGAAFQAKGLGGTAPLEAWATKHLAKDGHVTTFDTLKHLATVRAPKPGRKAKRPR